MAYSIQAADIPGTYATYIEFIDGDYKKVHQIDPDGFVPQDRWDEVFYKVAHYPQGLPLEDTHVPTRAKLTGSKRTPQDVYNAYSTLFVSDRFKALVEADEPGVHQFFPIQLERPNGEVIGQYHWFNPCHRVVAVPEGRSTSGKNVWRLGDEGLVLDRSAVAGKAAFILKRIHTEKFVSDAVAEGYEAQGMTGALLFKVPEREFAFDAASSPKPRTWLARLTGR